MPQEILNSMRALREDMRQRLLQSPEYRALEALDRSIEEICDILSDPGAVGASPAFVLAHRETAPLVEQARAAAAETPPTSRQGAIATAFAESLAARLDQRGGPKAGGAHQAPNGLRGG